MGRVSLLPYFTYNIQDGRVQNNAFFVVVYFCAFYYRKPKIHICAVSLVIYAEKIKKQCI